MVVIPPTQAPAQRGEWYDDEGKWEHRRKVLPPHVVRRLAHESSEGGRARCHFCGYSFCAGYMKMVRVAPWPAEEDFVCKDCREVKGLN